MRIRGLIAGWIAANRQRFSIDYARGWLAGRFSSWRI